MPASSSPPRLALLVDNPNRDLPGLVLTAWELARRGARCLLVPMNLREDELWALAPDLVLLNHCKTIYRDLLQGLCQAGIQVAVLDTEGGVFSALPGDSSDPEDSPALAEYGLSLLPDEDLRRQVALYCAWTPAFARQAAARGWYQPEQIAVTGNPRTDFYARPWRTAALAAAGHLRDYADPLVLINCNFTLANPRFQSPEQEAEMMIQRFSYGREFIMAWLEAQRAALAQMMELAGRLARDLAQATVVVRPHPFEGHRAYEKGLARLPNLHLDGRGTVDAWLLRARALVHWNSSTALEGCALGIPALVPDWIPQHVRVPAVDRVSIFCASYAELVERVRDILEGGFQLPENISKAGAQVLEQTYYRLDGRAHRRLAQALLDAAARRRQPSDLAVCRRRAEARKTARQAGAAWDHSPKSFSHEQVRALLEAIQEAAGEPGPGLELVPAERAGEYRLEPAAGRSLVLHAPAGEEAP